MSADRPTVVTDERAPGVMRVTLAHAAKRNALSVQLMQGLLNALERLGTEQQCRAIIIAADGPVFSSGHDLAELRQDENVDRLRDLFKLCSTLMTTVARLPQPVIAQVQGLATAAGCQLVASCDLAVASASARFATPGVSIGLFCSTPMVALSRNVARKQAMQMLLTGDPINADEALRAGLVNQVVDDNALSEAVLDLARRIVERPREIIALGKAAFYRQCGMSLADAYDYTSSVMVKNLLRDEAKEGIDAFLQKRKPSWP